MTSKVKLCVTDVKECKQMMHDSLSGLYRNSLRNCSLPADLATTLNPLTLIPLSTTHNYKLPSSTSLNGSINVIFCGKTPTVMVVARLCPAWTRLTLTVAFVIHASYNLISEVI